MPPWISIATCQKHSHSHSHVWQMYPHATCSTGLWAPSPPLCLPLLLPPLKTYVKWQKIKYPVVKMRFSDKCDTHATAGQANNHTNTHTERERDKQTNKPIQSQIQIRETLAEVSNGVICDRHGRTTSLPLTSPFSSIRIMHAQPSIWGSSASLPPSCECESPQTIHSNPIASHSRCKSSLHVLMAGRH